MPNGMKKRVTYVLKTSLILCINKLIMNLIGNTGKFVYEKFSQGFFPPA